jgi:alginate O-acetyltransferase complex protein AlgJ
MIIRKSLPYSAAALAIPAVAAVIAWAFAAPGTARMAAQEAGPPAGGKRPRSFFAACAAAAAKAEKAEKMAVAGKDGWQFLAKELRHVGVGCFWGKHAARVSRATKPDWADPVPAILDFKSQLDAAGIDLLLVPVPPKVAVYPDKLLEGFGPPARRLDAYHEEFYELLRKKGTLLLDLSPPLVAARKGEKQGEFAYCKTDSHYSPRTCELIAGMVRKFLGKRKWLPAGAGRFKTAREEIAIEGDLGGKEKLPVRKVTGADGASTVDRKSPVLLLGDSHCLVFHEAELHGASAGLVDQLAAELGIPVDLLGVRGSGATPARIALLRRAMRDKSYMAGKKLVVWCFSAREFTETQGWRKVPVLPLKPLK